MTEEPKEDPTTCIVKVHGYLKSSPRHVTFVFDHDATSEVPFVLWRIS